MQFQDRNIECIDCHEAFLFTAGEQEFYDRKGFKEIPKRCKNCRDRRKTKRDGGGGGGMPDDYGNRMSTGGGGGGRGGYSGGTYSAGGHERGDRGGGGGGGGGGGQREFFEATCAACGAPARVPFKPAANRPVYCRDCYQSRQTGY